MRQNGMWSIMTQQLMKTHAIFNLSFWWILSEVKGEWLFFKTEEMLKNEMDIKE